MELLIKCLATVNREKRRNKIKHNMSQFIAHKSMITPKKKEEISSDLQFKETYVYVEREKCMLKAMK